MQDNKVRLSPDVLEKAERIAAEWGLKNARAAVEAVFRKYCDDYLYGRPVTRSRLTLQESAATYGYRSGQAVPAYIASSESLETVPPAMRSTFSISS